MRSVRPVFTLILCTLAAALAANQALAQDAGPVGPSPYEFTSEQWLPPFAQQGRTWGGNSGVYVQNPDRIFFLQRGETELPDPIPDDYTRFAGSMGWNILRGRGRIWNNCIYIVNSEGDVLEVWDQWDYLFHGTDGPGPHRIKISPYDPENRVWVVDETGHIIYVFSNDGEELLMTLGEKNVPGDDETHYNLPQDIVFLPDGKFLVADGLGNRRIVVRNADGSYHSEFGEGGDAAHQFSSVHILALGPDEKLYAVDRDAANVKVFQQTAAHSSPSYPVFEHVDTWGGLDIPLSIIVGSDSAWVTDLRPPKLIKFDFDGNREYTWHLPEEGPHMWIEMHSMDIDAAGNLYATDNQAGRPQKLVPKPDADPALLVQPQYIPR